MGAIDPFDPENPDPETLQWLKAELSKMLDEEFDGGIYVEHEDGTKWFFSNGLNIWTGWTPGEEGCWTMTPEEYTKTYG